MKKLFTFCLAAIVCCGIGAAAVTLDAPEKAYDIPTELAEATYEKGAPGINILTGTPEPEGFETKSISDFSFTSWDASKSEATIVDDTERENNKALCFVKGHFLNMIVSTNLGVEGKRPIYLIYDAKSDGTSTKYLIPHSNYNGGNFAYYNNNVTNTKWATLAEGHSQMMYFRKMTTTAETWTTIYFGYGQGGVTEKVYIDNLFMAPYYKLTYKAGEGTGADVSEYFYADKYAVSFADKGFTAPEGKIFSHWVDSNGNVVTDEVIPTPGYDIELTAVYANKADMATTLPIASIKVSAPQGIRIAGFVSSKVKAMADEYGFIAALDKNFEGGNYDGFVFGNDEIELAQGIAYSKADKIDIFYTDDKEEAKELFGDEAKDEDGVYFTGVYTGIPETSEAYKEKIAGRAYVKLGEVYCYGATTVRSVYETALAVKAKCEASGEEVPEYVTDAIEIAEAK